MLLIAFSFVASFAIAMVVTGALTGSDEAGDPGETPAAEVGVYPKKQLPSAGRWRLTVAAMMAGGRSVTLVRGRTAASPKPAIEVTEERTDGSAAKDLQAQLDASTLPQQRRDAIVRFVDTAGFVDGPAQASRDDVATAVTSASLLAGALGRCLKDLRIDRETVFALMKPEDAFGLADRPHVTFGEPLGDETILSQVGILGRGRRSIAVGMVARVNGAPSPAARTDVLKKLAKWADDNLHAPKPYRPAC